MGKAKMILIIDDRSSNRLLLKRIVAALGHTTALAGNGPEGIDKACALSPDVILMDIGMPGMDGVEAMQQIKAKGVDASIFAWSEKTSAQDLASYTEAGFDGYLGKPVDARELKRLLCGTGGNTPSLKAQIH